MCQIPTLIKLFGPAYLCQYVYTFALEVCIHVCELLVCVQKYVDTWTLRIHEIEHEIPRPRALICCCLSLHCYGKVFHKSHESINEVTHWWAIRLAVSVPVIPKGVGWGWGQCSVQASEVLPHQTPESFLCGSVMLKQERAFPKLLPGSNYTMSAW